MRLFPFVLNQTPPVIKKTIQVDKHDFSFFFALKMNKHMKGKSREEHFV